MNDAAQHLRDADAVLFLGKKLDYTISFGGPPTFDPEARVIQVEPSRDLVGISRGADLSLVGDVGAVVDQLTAEAERLQWAKHPMLGELEEAARVQERSLESRAKGSSPLHAMDVHVRLRPLVDDDTCLIYEGSDFALYGAAYYPSQLPHRWFTGGTLGMIGSGVPFGLSRIHRRTALGTALEEAIGCSSESGIMVLEQKPARKQGAPNRCRHRTIPTVSASSLTTIA